MKKTTYQILIFLTILLSIYLIMPTIKSPYFHANISLNESSDFVVTAVGPKGEAYKLGLKKDDIILEINGEKLEDYTMYKKLHKIEQVRTLTYIQDGKIITKEIEQNYNSQEYFDYLIFPTLMLVSCIILCFFLVSRQINRSATPPMFFFLLLLGLGYMSSGASTRGDLLANIVVSISLSLAPVLLLNLLIEIFEKIGVTSKWKAYLKSLYLLAIVLIAIIAVHDVSNFYYPQLYKIQLLFFSLIFGFNLIFLGNMYRRSQAVKGKTTVKILLLGVGLSFAPFIFLYIIPFLTIHTSLVDSEISTMFLFILPFTILYLILQDRVFDVDYWVNAVKSTFYYAGFIGLLFYIATLLIGNKQPISNLFIVICVSFLVLFYKNHFALHKPKKLEQPYRDFHEQLTIHFNRESVKRSSPQFMTLITDEIKRNIPRITTATYFEIDKLSNHIESLAQDMSTVVQPYLQLLTKDHQEIGRMINLKDGFCIYVLEKNDAWSFLYCGYKIDGTNLNPIERSWFKTIANYSNLLLTNQYTIENVVQELSDLKEGNTHYSRWLSKFLFSYSEKERVRLASDIHDAVLQELTVINNRLATLSKEPLATETIKEIQDIRELVLDCIFTTRETCNELVPPFLFEFGLIRAIENFIVKKHLEVNFHITFTHHGFSDKNLSKDYVITLFRITQELITNAQKHSEAGTVQFTLLKEKNTIKFYYIDDGIGLDASNINKDMKRFSGIISIIERVKNLNGEIEFSSEEGFQVEISLPETPIS